MDPRASTMSKPLVGYQLEWASKPISPREGQLYTYVFGRDGVYIKGERPRLSCQFQIGSSYPIRGLSEIEEYFTFEPKRIPSVLVEDMITRARQEALRDLEILFHFVEGPAGSGVHSANSFGGWTLAVPEQTQSHASCKPVDSGPDSSHSRALVEVHSHHNMEAYFSAGDDKDEQGFRIYAVIGNVLNAPEINVRLGLHGHFWRIPSNWVFERYTGLKDYGEQEEERF